MRELKNNTLPCWLISAVRLRSRSIWERKLSGYAVPLLTRLTEMEDPPTPDYLKGSKLNTSNHCSCFLTEDTIPSSCCHGDLLSTVACKATFLKLLLLGYFIKATKPKQNKQAKKKTPKTRSREKLETHMPNVIQRMGLLYLISSHLHSVGFLVCITHPIPLF